MNRIGDGRHTQLDITGLLLRKKWQIAITFLLVVGAVIAVTLLMPKQYRARMKILVKNERAETVVTTNSNSGSAYRGEVSETQINTEIELLNSHDLLREVVTKCGLYELNLTSDSVSKERQFQAVEKAVLRLQDDLKIAPIRKADIIEIEYISSDRVRAAAVLKQFGDFYLEMHLKTHATPGTFEFFTDQTQRYEDELQQRDEELAEFRRQNDIVMLVQQKEITLQRAADAEWAEQQAEATIGEHTQKLADTRRQLVAAPPRVLTQTRTVPNQLSVERLGSMLAELTNRRTLLLAKFRPDDRMVLEVDKEIADTQTALESAKKLTGVEQATDVNPLHQTLEIEGVKEMAELAGIVARREALVQQSQGYRRQLLKLDGATAQYENLTRSRKEAEENYLLYKRKSEEARIAESLDQQKIANVAIVENPIEPYRPFRPNVPLNLAIGVALAGFVSVGLAFTTDYFRSSGQHPLDVQPGIAGLRAQDLLGTVESPSELEALTGLVVLATPHRRELVNQHEDLSE